MVLHFIAKATFLNNHQKNILPKCISGGLNTKSPALNNTRISLKTCLLLRMFVTSPPQDIIPLQPCSYFIADWKLHPYTSGNFPGGHFSHFMSVRCGNQLTKTWTFYRPLFFCVKSLPWRAAGSVRSTLLFNFCELNIYKNMTVVESSCWVIVLQQTRSL